MYVFWVRRFILFHNKRHPESMGCTEIEAFLSHLTAAGGDALPRLPALGRLPVVASLGVEVDKVLGACATWRAEMMLSPYGRWTSGMKRNILRQSPTVGSSRLEG
jgi:hypothetical protein